MKLPNLAECRKALVAIAGLAAQLVALGVLSGSALHYVTAGLSLLTALGVYQVKNAVTVKAVPVVAPVAPAVIAPPAPPAA